MSFLELKIPPLALLFIACVFTYGLSGLEPFGLVFPAADLLALLCLVISAVFIFSGVFEFRRAQTTVNPMLKTESSALVTSGIYKFSRNPMYVGFVFIILAASVYWLTWAGIPVAAGFVLYMTQFQIKPEERYLSGLFNDYDDYKMRVRRWL
ncbi:isoprenylcysteine carboxylmethyltransferase family protein [Parasalinivibrio latis]|uniref:methyltransferase family protein n=1 Tax=Parasalinivibrio latis TaxID=2952610 RepID=UPI0030DF7354